MDKAMSMAGFDSFKGALSGVANFDLDGLMGATGENKAGMLKGLLGESNNLGDAAKALMGAMGK